MLVALVEFVAVLGGWLVGDVRVDLPWAPTLGLRLDFALDGLGALYALLATGIGGVVFVYGLAYLPRHLDHRRSARHATLAASGRGWSLFMGAMVGLATARDLILMFLFFDLTAVASYFLIGFDRDRVEARGAALMALTVTGVSAVLMLMGAVLLYAEYGTFSVPELADRVRPGGTTTSRARPDRDRGAGQECPGPAPLLAARVPWRRRPRSRRTCTRPRWSRPASWSWAACIPLLAVEPLVLEGLVVVGFASILVGGLLALGQDELKQILAHSTISQYGYVVVLYGLGGAAGAAAAAFYVVAHAIAKSALFMTAGAITESTGESRLSHLGGLARSMPVLAIASGIAAATLAAVPLTIGFFKDELFFTAALGAGGSVPILAVAAAALTVAYIGRFWLGLFAGPLRTGTAAHPCAAGRPGRPACRSRAGGRHRGRAVRRAGRGGCFDQPR